MANCIGFIHPAHCSYSISYTIEGRREVKWHGHKPFIANVLRDQMKTDIDVIPGESLRCQIIQTIYTTIMLTQ